MAKGASNVSGCVICNQQKLCLGKNLTGDSTSPSTRDGGKGWFHLGATFKYSADEGAQTKRAKPDAHLF